MNEKEADELRQALVENIEKELDKLIYKQSKCDFEHIWNCAIDKAKDCLEGYS